MQKGIREKEDLLKGLDSCIVVATELWRKVFLNLKIIGISNTKEACCMSH